MVNEKAETIRLKGKSNLSFFLIHGYTGSPMDFNELPEYLNREYGADVTIIRLRGHGKKVANLDDVGYKIFSEQIEEEFKKEHSKGKKIIVGGISFGALMAIKLSQSYDVDGLFLVSLPYKLKFPFNIPQIKILGKFKKYWKKFLTKEEKMMRKGFYYPYMHKNGLDIIEESIRKVKSLSIKNSEIPALVVHVRKDAIADVRGIKEILSTSFPNSELKIFDSNIHNIFYSRYHKKVYEIFGDFLDRKFLKKKIKKKRVAAIIPAYNEEERIAGVLSSLSDSKLIDEIIVVDDGSKDGTEREVSKFKNVKYMKNKKNMGKSASMQRGVASSNAEIIFFCDADLINFKGEYADGIISPVLNGKVDMFIGLRKNFMQRAVKKWAINSGERAMPKVVWDRIPKYYKHRYRIEAGLNNFVSRFGNGFGYKQFDYSQPVKEKKYGFFKGFILRWWMNLDVTLSVLRFHFYDRFRKNKFSRNLW